MKHVPRSRTRAAREARGWRRPGLEVFAEADEALTALAEGRSPSVHLEALEKRLVERAGALRPSKSLALMRLLLVAGEFLADDELVDAVEQRHASPASGDASLAEVVRQLVRAGLGADAPNLTKA